MTPEVLMTIIKIAAVFIAVSFVIFWVGMVWWVSQDVLSRTNDKIIVSAAVAMTAILGPVGMLLYLIIRPKQTIQESVGEMMEREMLLHAASSTICPTCGRMAQEDFVSCPHCGTKIKEHCPNCKQLVSVDWEHCPYCEAHLRAARASVTAPAETVALNLQSPSSASAAVLRRRHRRAKWSAKVKGLWQTIGQKLSERRAVSQKAASTTTATTAQTIELEPEPVAIQVKSEPKKSGASQVSPSTKRSRSPRAKN